MKGLPDRRYDRPDVAIDQRTFGDHGEEIGLDDQDVHSVWSDVLSLGKQFRHNIADAMLGTSMQPRRGEILVTRDGAMQETRAVRYRAKRHGEITLALPHDEVETHVPREHERRSLRTARHSRHSRAHFSSPQQERPSPNEKLAAGGFATNLGRKFKLLAIVEERTKANQEAEAAKRKAQKPTDDIQF